MTNNSDDQSSSEKSNRPSHIAYHVQPGKNGTRYWHQIGSAWPHTDGQGFSLQLKCTPLDGYVSLRTAQDKP